MLVLPRRRKPAKMQKPIGQEAVIPPLSELKLATGEERQALMKRLELLYGKGWTEIRPDLANRIPYGQRSVEELAKLVRDAEERERGKTASNAEKKALLGRIGDRRDGEWPQIIKKIRYQSYTLREYEEMIRKEAAKKGK
jgi:hypothetical protein